VHNNLYTFQEDNAKEEAEAAASDLAEVERHGQQEVHRVDIVAVAVPIGVASRNCSGARSSPRVMASKRYLAARIARTAVSSNAPG
jgi:hypothetical protein